MTKPRQSDTNRSQTDVSTLFDSIERNFDKIAEQHREELEEAWIKPIHPEFPFAQNGICALIASMGSGKSYNYIKMAAKQELVGPSIGGERQPFFELVAICSTSAKFDKTVETYKHLITRSKLVAIKDTELLDWLNKYMRRILKYNAINDFIKRNQFNDESIRIFTKHNLLSQEELDKWTLSQLDTRRRKEVEQSNKQRAKVVVTEDHSNKPVYGTDITANGKSVGALILTSSDLCQVISDPSTSSITSVERSVNLRSDGSVNLSQTARVQDADVGRKVGTNRSTEVERKQKRLRYIADKLTKYNWITSPHRCLLILDDFASHPLLRSKETEMSRLLKKLRHFNINVIICVQTVKSISKDIKRTLSDIVLFPGVGEEDFNDLIKESPASAFDRKLLYAEYKKLTNPHDLFAIHIKANKVVVTESRLSR